MKYVVSVCRISYAHKDIEVEANSPEWAAQLAREQEGNHQYNESNAEYEIQAVAEHTPDGVRHHPVPRGIPTPA